MRTQLAYLVQRVGDLVNVKTVVTFLVMGVFAALALRGDIEANQVVVIATTVLAFYFGTQRQKQDNEREEQGEKRE